MPKNSIAARILLVEDHPVIHQSLARNIRKHFHLDTVGTVAGACQYLAEQTLPYDVVVLDRNLPDGDGLEILPLVDDSTRVCVISQLNDTAAQIYGLRQGVDTYLPKPVTPCQVQENILALLRRDKKHALDTLEWGTLKFYPQDRRVESGSDCTLLTHREAQFFMAFLRSSHGRVTHQNLHHTLWNDGAEPTTSIIHVTIQRLRKKLEPFHITIQGVYGLGYQLIAPQ